MPWLRANNPMRSNRAWAKHMISVYARRLKIQPPRLLVKVMKDRDGFIVPGRFGGRTQMTITRAHLTGSRRRLSALLAHELGHVGAGHFRYANVILVCAFGVPFLLSYIAPPLVSVISCVVLFSFAFSYRFVGYPWFEVQADGVAMKAVPPVTMLRSRLKYGRAQVTMKLRKWSFSFSYGPCLRGEVLKRYRGMAMGPEPREAQRRAHSRP